MQILTRFKSSDVDDVEIQEMTMSTALAGPDSFTESWELPKQSPNLQLLTNP